VKELPKGANGLRLQPIAAGFSDRLGNRALPGQKLPVDTAALKSAAGITRSAYVFD